MPSTLIVLASLLGIYIPVLVSPGPNFLVVTQTAIRHSRRHAIWTALGVSSASTILAAFAATGMGILVAHLPGFQHGVQLTGGVYLLYTAGKIWGQARDVLGEAAAGAERSLRRAYWFGLATNLSNPKALVFFATIFASMIPPGSSSLLIVAGVAGISITSSVWHLALANWFSGGRMQRAYRNAKPLINRVTACILAGLGASLLWQLAAGFNSAF
ncbi:MAG TPA: LysE family translocator [Burkholderiaceae bacterium]